MSSEVRGPRPIQVVLDEAKDLDFFDFGELPEPDLATPEAAAEYYRWPQAIPHHWSRHPVVVWNALPQWLRLRMRSRKMWHQIQWTPTCSGDLANHPLPASTPVRAPRMWGAEAWSSGPADEGWNGHLVVMDIDHEAVLLPSSQEGHYHLVINVETSRKNLMQLLRVAVRCGIVEPGYAKASRARGEAFLRLPWVRKNHEKEDALRALELWMEDETPNG